MSQARPRDARRADDMAGVQLDALIDKHGHVRLLGGALRWIGVSRGRPDGIHIAGMGEILVKGQRRAARRRGELLDRADARHAAIGRDQAGEILIVGIDKHAVCRARGHRP